MPSKSAFCASAHDPAMSIPCSGRFIVLAGGERFGLACACACHLKAAHPRAAAPEESAANLPQGVAA